MTTATLTAPALSADSVLSFEPPAPVPRSTPATSFEILRTVWRNPLELWGEPSYTLPWIHTRFVTQRTIIVNDPGLIRYILVETSPITRCRRCAGWCSGPSCAMAC